ncbi:hypothetical protein AAU57_10070 [Nonlabens sp. YIK11]|uniref:hypothetical protein n=1 Tax=Nonlabens sp. YIK11 TaxID=1453349 RepID=UPI0006DCC869|nr:hypothetical protein [Nonlabens sp. YIK11]KQC33630.1 hypothetical protein AAU57_10070 [Nonlabens sp. YIK11]
MDKIYKGFVAGSIAAAVLSLLFYSSEINFQYEYFNWKNFAWLFLQTIAPLMVMAIYYLWRTMYKLKDLKSHED